MERPVGDKFKINGCVYVVVEDVLGIGKNPCKKCAFPNKVCMSVVDIRGRCTRRARKDGMSVHFEYFGAGVAPQDKKGGE